MFQVTSSYSVPTATSTPNCHQARERDAQQTLPGIAVTPSTREYVRVYGGWEERVQECCRNMSDDSVYARPQNSPGQGVINSNFQRQDWFRQRSHLKRLNSGGTSSGSSSKSSYHASGSSSGSASSGVGGLHHHSYRNTGPNGLIRRSASEESLLNGVSELNSYDDEDGVGVKKPALHRKGKAPLPPHPANASSLLEVRDNYTCYKPATPITRSKSAHHLHMELDGPSPYAKKDTVNFTRQDADVLVDTSGHVIRPHRSGHRKAARSSTEDWSRSRSTPHIATVALEEVDRSYDSSTLSDDDSTPHVSRSNSRGKDCAAANSAWESAYGTAPTELLVHAAPVNIHEESCSDSDPSPHVSGIPMTPAHHRKLGTIAPPIFAQESSAPPLPPKRSSAEVKLRHLPPVHVDAPSRTQSTRPQSSYISGEEPMVWENSDAQVPRKPPERRGRLRQRDLNSRASQRSKSLPPPPGEDVSVEDDEKPYEERNHPPNLQGEISWSVSHLRSLFTTSGGQPPPYRPPPSVIPSYRAPITSYHLGNSSQSERYVVSRHLLLDPGPRLRMDSTEEEESYV
ncbi:hypothetical protein PR048_006083 [Dryococelus australis]|uniref:ERBB receptor feedback inhibitor 1 n=1 Tax=Dryococelus australis TaxID=614101 RepID=A0ABQ9IB62_9NEOP|nr:hypothetical protein PR048_006083 [Dryococelus australis]